MHGLLLDGQFESSLILLDDLWDSSLAKYTPKSPIVALPSRDVLAFCDAQSLLGIVELKQLVERSAENDHQLTTILYYRQDGQWLPLDLGFNYELRYRSNFHIMYLHGKFTIF